MRILDGNLVQFYKGLKQDSESSLIEDFRHGKYWAGPIKVARYLDFVYTFIFDFNYHFEILDLHVFEKS